MTDAAPEDGARFRQVLRGYDKVEVDTAIKRLTREVDALAAEVARLTAEGPAPAPAPTDLDAFAVDVASVLRAAQEAADDLRERTEADAASLRAEAGAEAERLLSEARERAEAAVADAEEDVRIVRAEAEREAHRITAAARKEAEELLRSARLDADRVHADASTERDQILAQARAEAEAAQERARALEIRRDELLAELESVRSTVVRLEGEIDETRAAPPAARAPEPEVEELERPAAEEAYSGVRIIPARDEEEPETGPVGQPVETMAMVEEVRRLHEAPEPEPAAVPAEPEPAAEPEEPRELPAEPEEPRELPAEPEEMPAEAEEPPVEPEEVPSSVEAPADAPSEDDDELDDLFAALRSPDTEAETADEPPEAEEARREPREEPIEPEAGPAPEPEPEPGPEPEAPPVMEPTAARPPTRNAHDPDVERALEDRDRRLIPITNGALRGMKRELADAQNEALEGLRADPDGWRPSRTELAEHLEPTLLLVRDAARRSGIAWALEWLGVDVAVPGQPSGNGSAAAGDLGASLERALDRGTDGPSRSAEVSRVFRAWRSDTAERHLRAEAGRAYHEGIAAAAEAAGRPVELVVVRACPQCAEAAEASDPSIPPVHDGCRCILLPAG